MDNKYIQIPLVGQIAAIIAFKLIQSWEICVFLNADQILVVSIWDNQGGSYWCLMPRGFVLLNVLTRWTDVSVLLCGLDGSMSVCCDGDKEAAGLLIIEKSQYPLATHLWNCSDIKVPGGKKPRTHKLWFFTSQQRQERVGSVCKSCDFSKFSLECKRNSSHWWVASSMGAQWLHTAHAWVVGH